MTELIVLLHLSGALQSWVNQNLEHVLLVRAQMHEKLKGVGKLKDCKGGMNKLGFFSSISLIQERILLQLVTEDEFAPSKKHYGLRTDFGLLGLGMCSDCVPHSQHVCFHSSSVCTFILFFSRKKMGVRSRRSFPGASKEHL